MIDDPIVLAALGFNCGLALLLLYLGIRPRRKPVLRGIRMSFQQNGEVGQSLVLSVTGIFSDGQPHPLPSPVVFTATPPEIVTFAPHADGVSTVATFSAPGSVTFTATESVGEKTFTDTGTATFVAAPPPPPPPPPELTGIVLTAALAGATPPPPA